MVKVGPARLTLVHIVSASRFCNRRCDAPVHMVLRTGRDVSAGMVDARQPSSTSTLAANFSQSMSKEAELSTPEPTSAESQF